MAITQITTDFAGQDGIAPQIPRIVTTDDLTTITTAGYLDNVQKQGFVLNPTDVVLINYDNGTASGFFTVSITNGITTLAPLVSAGEVVLPVVSGNFANFTGTTGAIADEGYVPLDATKTNVVMASAAVIANHIACFSDVAGTVNDDAATAINGGNIQAGLSGTAGTLASFPATAARGSLVVAAVANTGNTNTTISNAAMGQASVISIPDPAGATANFAIAPSALVNGNIIEASGTAGLVVDSGVATADIQLNTNIIAATTGNIGGAGAGPITVPVAALTAASVVVATLVSSSNAVQVQTCIAGAGSFDVTFSGDPGASAILNYVAFVAAQ